MKDRFAMTFFFTSLLDQLLTRNPEPYQTVDGVPSNGPMELSGIIWYGSPIVIERHHNTVYGNALHIVVAVRRTVAQKERRNKTSEVHLTSYFLGGGSRGAEPRLQSASIIMIRAKERKASE